MTLPAKKPFTAKERTVDMFLGTTFAQPQENRAPRIVDLGERVLRVPLELGVFGSVDYRPANHYRRPTSMVTLCGLPVKDIATGGELKDCQACRAEASKLRAVVGR